MFTTYVLVFCRATIALLFAFSFGSKFLALRDFAVSIGDFKLLPRRWSKILAWLFLCGELATIICITFGGNLLPFGFLLAMALLLIFSMALITALRRKVSMSCNCFGRTERHLSRYDVARNVFLILCSLVGLWMMGSAQHNLAIGEIILLALMSTGLLLLITNLSDVIETLLRPFPVSDERR